MEIMSICLSFWVTSSGMVRAITSKSGQQKYAYGFLSASAEDSLLEV
jgi:hypothetical protein